MRTIDDARPATSDWDEASHAVSSAYFAHRLRPAGRTDASHVTVTGAQFGPVRIATIGWGALVDVETDHRDGIAVNVPLSGSLHSIVGRAELVATRASGTVYPADTPTLIRGWSPTCSIVGVRFDRDFLTREIARVSGAPYALPSRIDLAGPDGAAWFRLVTSLRDQPALPPMAAERLAAAVADAFVLAVLPETPACPPAPRIVKRVVDRIAAEPELAWTAGDMAEVAGVSVRRLQEGFRAYLGETPREHLTRVRLDRTRSELLDGAVDTVAAVAAKWGFMHTSRFAAEYHRAYGEYPSETLRGRIR